MKKSYWFTAGFMALLLLITVWGLWDVLGINALNREDKVDGNLDLYIEGMSLVGGNLSQDTAYKIRAESVEFMQGDHLVLRMPEFEGKITQQSVPTVWSLRADIARMRSINAQGRRFLKDLQKNTFWLEGRIKGEFTSSRGNIVFEGNDIQFDGSRNVMETCSAVNIKYSEANLTSECFELNIDTGDINFFTQKKKNRVKAILPFQ